MKTLIVFSLLLLNINSYSQNILAEGDVPPKFNLMSVQGDMISLDDYEDKKVLLAFFRYAGCPVCNFRMHELMENYNNLQSQNIEVIAVFESGNETLKKYIDDVQVPFPIIGDEELKLYKEYKVQKSFGKVLGTLFQKEPKQNMKKGKKLFADNKYKKDGSTTRIPAEFLIDTDGKIEKAHYGKFIGDHMPIEALLTNG
ncbi:MAG: redoxin domain-containing protein [Bacteroidota bacterium]